MTGRILEIDNSDPAERSEVTSFLAAGNTALFRWSAWLDIFHEAYGLKGIYYTLRKENGTLQGALPGVIIKSTVVCLPFLDYIPGACSENPDLFNGVAREAVRKGLAYHIRLNRRQAGLSSISAEDCGNVTMRLKLAETCGDCWNGFSPKVRNQVRKSEKEGVHIREGDEHLAVFYRIWSRHITALGTPVHSERFFRAVFRHLPRDRRILLTAWHGKIPIGGLILLLDGSDEAFVPWAAVSASYRSLCVNHGMYWHAIKKAVSGGASVFDFLRSQKGSGTYRFKKQWGAETVPLYYYYSKGAVGAGMGTSDRYLLFRAVWKRLPRHLTVPLGPVFRKNIP